MLSRGEDGKLSFERLQAELFFYEFFEQAKNAREIEWVGERLQEAIEDALVMRENELDIREEDEDEE